MKKVLFTLTLTLSTLLFSSCEDRNVANGRKLYKAYFNHILKDPDSFRIYNEEYEKDGVLIKWTLDYGAKNSMGGMIRKTEKFETISGITLHINSNYYGIDDLK